MNPRKTSPALASLPAVVGLVACAACCTLPFLVPALLSAGIGSAALVWISTRSELLGLVCLALGAAVAGFQWWRSRRAEATGPSCAADGSCGCAPAASSEKA